MVWFQNETYRKSMTCIRRADD